MKNTIKVLGFIALAVIITLSTVSCGGGVTLNSPESLKEYLDKQPANTPDKPISISMGANEQMIPKIREILNLTGKYVNLTISGKAVTTIPNYAFNNCKMLISITLPNSVTSIGEMAFAGGWDDAKKQPLGNITKVTLANGVTTIGNKAFINNKLTNITIPNSVTSIGDNAFESNQLIKVIIPNTVTTIGKYVFGDNSKLTNVTIGKGVTAIGEGAFYECSSLTDIKVDPANTSYSSDQGVLYDKDKTTLIKYPPKKAGAAFTIPNSVTTIAIGAFSDSTTLTNVTIPDSVTSIMLSAFNGCTALTEVTIPSNVTKIDQSAFFGCTALTSVTFQGTIVYNSLGRYYEGGWWENSYWISPFTGDLRAKYLAAAGGIGTYTTDTAVPEDPTKWRPVWTKKATETQ
jgi:hypothetical protein